MLRPMVDGEQLGIVAGKWPYVEDFSPVRR